MPRGGKGTVTQVIFGPDRIRLTVDLGYDATWSRPELVRMDRDRDGRVSEEEADAYTEFQWTKRVEPGLKARFNGESVSWRKVTQRYEGPLGQPRSTPISFYYDLEIDVTAAPEADRKVDPETPTETLNEDDGTSSTDAPTSTLQTFELETLAFADPTRYPPLFVVPYIGHAPGAEPGMALEPRFTSPENVRMEAFGYLLEGPRLVVEYRFHEGTEPVTPQLPPPLAAPGGPTLEFALRRWDGGSWFRWLALAFFWGVGWGFSPASGSLLVVVCLGGTHRGLRAAVRLGWLTAAVQAVTMLLLGGALGSPREPGWESTEPALVAGTQLAAGALIVLAGTWLFWRHWSGAASAWEPRRGELVVLAFGAGLPVAAGSLRSFSIALETEGKLAFGTCLAIAFALGLGTAASALAALVATARPLVFGTRTARATAVRPWMPALLGLFVAALGAFLIARVVEA